MYPVKFFKELNILLCLLIIANILELFGLWT